MSTVDKRAGCSQILIGIDMGGATRVAFTLAEHLRTQGERGDVWIPAPGVAMEEARRRRLPVHTYDRPGAFSRWRLRAAWANARLAQSLRRYSPALVHVHCPILYGSLRHAFRWAGVRTIVHMHAAGEIRHLRWALRPAPDAIITCNRILRDLASNTVMENGNNCFVTMVPNAVDLERFCPGNLAEARRRVAAPPDRPLVLMLANLDPIKGQDTALRMTAILKAQGVDITLWLAGSERGGKNHYSNHLKSLCRELGLEDRVTFLGERNDAPELLRAADIFLLPSSTEGMPLSLLEAQAVGVPAVVAPVGGIPDLVKDGESGFLVRHDDPEGYARAVALLLGNPELRAALAATARRRVLSEHAPETFLSRMDAIYAQTRPASSQRRPKVSLGVQS